MQITELILRNFGKFKDKKVTLSEGIQLFYGENESGKSTIHTFIKGMLFGMERKRGRASQNDVFTQYEPWENPGYYSGVLRFESEGKHFCIQRAFDKVSKKVELICEDDGEEFSVEWGDLQMLLDGMTATAYDNTISIGQLRVETDRTLADELRDFATNCYAGGAGDLNLTEAISRLKERKKESEKELKEALRDKQQQRERTEQEASYVWRELHKLRESLQGLEEEIAVRTVQEEEKKTNTDNTNVSGKGVIDEIRPDKWRIHPLEILVFMLFIILPMFLLSKPWNYMMSIILFLSCGIYVWNRMKEAKKPEKTEPEKILEEITPDEEKASLEKLRWERDHVKVELKDREIEYENIKEQIAEMNEIDDHVREIEKRKDSVQYAIDKLEELAGKLGKKMEEQLNVKASEILSKITGGKYTHLVVEEQLRVSLICDGRKIPISQVSRGTIEQIYFALRMVATDMLDWGHLPVILDDTFAYYDDVRLENTLKWLADQKRQILIFTCQKREEEILKKLNIPYVKEEV